MYYIESSLIRVKGLSFQKICGAMSVKEHNSIINCVNNIGWPLLRVSKLTFRALAHHQSKWWRAYAQNNSFETHLQWPVYIINPVDNT